MICIASFCDRNQLKGERLILAPSFRGFISWSIGSIALGPKVRPNIKSESVWWSKAAHLMVARKKKDRMASGTKYSLQRPAPHEPLPPTRPYLLVSNLPQYHQIMNPSVD
jgi:hypothetical protein